MAKSKSGKSNVGYKLEHEKGFHIIRNPKGKIVGRAKSRAKGGELVRALNMGLARPPELRSK